VACKPEPTQSTKAVAITEFGVLSLQQFGDDQGAKKHQRGNQGPTQQTQAPSSEPWVTREDIAHETKDGQSHQDKYKGASDQHGRVLPSRYQGVETARRKSAVLESDDFICVGCVQQGAQQLVVHGVAAAKRTVGCQQGLAQQVQVTHGI